MHESQYKGKLSVYGLSDNKDLLEFHEKEVTNEDKLLVMDTKTVRWLKKQLKDASSEHKIVIIKQK